MVQGLIFGFLITELKNFLKLKENAGNMIKGIHSNWNRDKQNEGLDVGMFFWSSYQYIGENWPPKTWRNRTVT